MQPKKKVLLFGSGLMSESVVHYILHRPQNDIHIASNIIQDAKKIADKAGLDRCTYSEIDVSDSKAVGQLVQNCDIVISYVPAFLHIHIAKVCLEKGKNLVTASYVSPQMKQLDQKVKQKGLIFLNELGLDPGIDHLATMKIVHQTEKQGGKILQYTSWCGGLPSPQFCDNPIGYKFTWSPIGAFKALKNKAVYWNNQKQEVVEGDVLQYKTQTVEINQALTMEGYPNRNSVAYKQIYELKDARKVLRGTLRYRGFCNIVCAWKQIGLFNQQLAPKGIQKWTQLLEKLLEKEEGKDVNQKIKNRCYTKNENYKNLSEKEKEVKYSAAIKGFEYFGMFNPETKIEDIKKSLLENLVHLLEKKLSLKDGEADLVAMQHIFLIQKDGKKTIKKSTLVSIGDKKGFTAMALTVGSPTGIGAQLVLDGKVSERGVCIPKYPDIYEPVLKQLESVNIRLVETEQNL